MRVILFVSTVAGGGGKEIWWHHQDALSPHCSLFTRSSWVPLKAVCSPQRHPSATHFIPKPKDVYLKGQLGPVLTACNPVTSLSINHVLGFCFCFFLIEKNTHFLSTVSIYLPDLVIGPVLTPILCQRAALTNEHLWIPVLVSFDSAPLLVFHTHRPGEFGSF